jgi:hypothetical protein
MQIRNDEMKNDEYRIKGRRLRIIWRSRRWRTKIIFARRGPKGEMFGTPPKAGTVSPLNPSTRPC